MKRFLVFTLLFVGLSLTVMSQQNSNDVQLRMQITLSVKGGVGVEQFFLALLHGLDDCFCDITALSQIEEGELIVDKRNGYVRWFTEGAGSQQMQCCYWNRSDGSKLIAFYYDQHDMDEGDKITCKSFLQFYTYNAKTKCLVPISLPCLGKMSGRGHLIVKLPRKGKDIQYRFGNEQDTSEFNTLKWNGLDFTLLQDK